jgi:hypothetical protein
MLRNWIIHNNIATSIILFLLTYFIINSYKPGCLYNKDGSFREFGIGYRKKTIVPIWLLAIVLAILSYFSIMYYIETF